MELHNNTFIFELINFRISIKNILGLLRRPELLMTLVLWLFELFYIFKGPSQSVSKSAFSRHLGFCDGGGRIFRKFFISKTFYRIPTPSKVISVKHLVTKNACCRLLGYKSLVEIPLMGFKTKLPKVCTVDLILYLFKAPFIIEVLANVWSTKSWVVLI